jgi:hypothetical protein
MCIYIFCLKEEEFEGTKGVIRIRNSKKNVGFFSVYYLCQIFICFGPIIIYAKYHIIDLVHNFAIFALLIILFI